MWCGVGHTGGHLHRGGSNSQEKHKPAGRKTAAASRADGSGKFGQVTHVGGGGDGGLHTSREGGCNGVPVRYMPCRLVGRHGGQAAAATLAAAGLVR